jgi:energy-coupling factor transporter transmembrane protein EcfT
MNAFSSFYIPGNSFIHRLDPRSKLICAMALSIVSLQGNYLALIAISAIVFVLLFLSRISFHYILRPLKPALPFVIILFGFQVLFPTDTHDAILSFGPMHLTAKGIIDASGITWRFVLLLFSGALLTTTTLPSGLTQGIERLLRPIAVIGVSSQDIAFMATLALRFIPTIAMEIDTLRSAHAARGAMLSEGGVEKRLKTAVALVVPLCLAIFRRCDDLIIAMEARGYDGGKRTGLTALKMSKRDWVVIALSISAVALTFAIPLWRP